MIFIGFLISCMGMTMALEMAMAMLVWAAFSLSFCVAVFSFPREHIYELRTAIQRGFVCSNEVSSR